MRKNGWIYFVLMFLFAIVVYREAMIPGNVLFTTDDGLGATAMRKSMFPHAFFAGWYDITAAGIPMFTAINSTNAWLSILSPAVFMNWIHLIDLVVGSWFLMMFLRLRGMGWLAAVLGALTTYWLGSTFFLTYAGHLGKFGAVMFAGIYLYLVERAIRDRSWPFAVLAGAAMGGMFLEQQDSALFFSLVLGPYAVFRGWQAYGFRIASHVKLLAPLLAVLVAISLHAVYSAVSFYKIDVPVDGDQQTEQEIWDYCTQWSWPPMETIEFIAPGFMGWRSGDQSGPYWGNLGQAPSWQEQFGPNGKNFKLETFYMGVIPIMFMFLALFVYHDRKRVDAAQRQQILFWLIAGIITFVLACGKYTPLYALFFKLPGISSIRNPVKFMQITQFAMGIIAAAGLDYWLTHLKNKSSQADQHQKAMGVFRKIMLYTAGVLTLATVVVMIQQGSLTASFREAGWQTASPVIARTMMMASLHMAVMAWIGFGLLSLGGAGEKIKYTSWKHLGWAAVLLVMADQLLVSHRYVQAVKEEALTSRGDLVPDLEQNLGYQRLYLWDQLPPQQAQWRGLYNQWQTILLANYQIPTVNIISTRMPDDLKKFYAVMGQNPLLMYSYMGMGMALMPTDFWRQVQNDRVMGQAFEPFSAYILTMIGGTGYSTIRVSGNQPSQQVLLRNRIPSERFALVSSWAGADLDGALARMLRTQPLSNVMITPEVPQNWSQPAGGSVDGKVSVDAYRGGKMELSVRSPQNAVLRVSEYFSPHWKAYVDGVEQAVVRCDGIFMGVYLPGSESAREVVLEFSPQRHTLYVQFAGFGAAGIALLLCFFIRKPEASDQKE